MSGDRELVQLLAQQSGNIKYYRNKTNIGLDDNVVRCIELARADYVFLFSDDDVLLPGAGACILDAIRRHSPAFVYVNHAGFLEDEDPDAVFRRGSSPDKPDVVYENGFLLIRAALLELNSTRSLAVGLQRSAAGHHPAAACSVRRSPAVAACGAFWAETSLRSPAWCSSRTS